MIKVNAERGVQMDGILTSNYPLARDSDTSPSAGNIAETSKIMVRETGRVYVPEGFAPGYYVWLVYRYLTGQSTEATNTRPEIDLFFDERITHRHSHLIKQVEIASSAASHSKISETSSSFGKTIKEQSRDDDVQVGSILTGRIMMRRTGRAHVLGVLTLRYYARLAYRYFTGRNTEVIDAHPETELVFDERVVREYSYLVDQAEATYDATSHLEISDKILPNKGDDEGAEE